MSSRVLSNRNVFPITISHVVLSASILTVMFVLTEGWLW